MTAVETASLVRAGEASAAEVVGAALERARAAESLNAFISLDEEGALARARLIDQRRAAGEDLGPLAGVPVALKDNLCVRGGRTTAGSRALSGFVSPYSATSVQRLEAAGAVVVGKTNLDEFAMGSSTENSAFGPTRNPWDRERVPGGSSGGSAAAVAAGVVPVALGSDTGGSIRQPAAYCGVVGFKPTYGRVSRHGLVAFASSLDQVGPFALSARDLAAVLDAVCGHDPLDSTSLAHENGFTAALGGSVAGLRFGLVSESLGAGNSAGVSGAVQAACAQLEALGGSVREVSLPSLAEGIATYYLIACPEASANLARYDGMVYSHRPREWEGEDVNEVMMRARGEAFGPEVKRRILMGTYALSSGYYDAYYSKALKARALIAREFAQAFQDVDVLVMPTAPTPAFRIGEKADDPVAMYLNDVDTVGVNLAGLPGVSVPFGFERDGAYSEDGGLPVGVQLVAPALKDELLVTVAAALEAATGGRFLRRAP
ncbi:MAG TPA: Asp-tRNA(Asn)/Glu-tRNA(Gln) amidotransferase subunit GatA [Deinococcales bacterium]|nr:Asp-tRNA(Asn)/Glu-tRNA(Gln) amidotransferase subunit GatA [Deinococcales bacterium]